MVCNTISSAELSNVNVVLHLLTSFVLIFFPINWHHLLILLSSPGSPRRKCYSRPSHSSILFYSLSRRRSQPTNMKSIILLGLAGTLLAAPMPVPLAAPPEAPYSVSSFSIPGFSIPLDTGSVPLPTETAHRHTPHPTGEDFSYPHPTGTDFSYPPHPVGTGHPHKPHPTGSLVEGNFPHPTGTDFPHPTGTDFPLPTGTDFPHPTGTDFPYPSPPSGTGFPFPTSLFTKFPSHIGVPYTTKL